MHDYEFTVSIPGSAAPKPKPIETPTPAPVKNAAFDWMEEDEPTKPQTTAQTSAASTKAPTSSTNTKPLCTYGTECRRKNPQHFLEYAHPHLDGNKSSPTVSPTPTNDSKPLCAYGVNCRRKNPQHFLECAHPHLDAKPIPSGDSVSPSPMLAVASTNEKSGLDPVKSDVTLSKQEETPKLKEIEENLKTNLHATTTVVKADTASNTSSGTSVAISVGKRPMPAVDLMDDEENFLPKSKKPKAASSTFNKANAMDWMTDDAPISSTPPTTVKKPETPPPPSPAPTSTPTSSQTKEDLPSSSLPPVPSSQGSNKSDSSKKEIDFKKRPALPSSSMDIDTTKQSSFKACQLTSAKELEDEITKLGWNPVGTVGLVIPSLGRTATVQESVDCLLETFEHFSSKANLKKSLKIYIWPETPAWAASLRRRLLALPTNSEDSTSSTISEMIEMLPPSSSLDSALPACTQDQLIIVNDSNWRFKGIGTPNSFNVQLNKLYSTPSNPKASVGPSLLNDTKAIYPVGAEGVAYPVPVSPSSGLKTEGKSTNLTHIIQLVTPTTPSTESLKSTLMSMFGSLLALVGK